MAKSSRLDSELEVLTALEPGEVVTQITLSRRLGVAVGLINALLKRAIRVGYVKTRQAPYKRYAYCLTPQGFAQKSRLVAEYLDRSLRFFRSARGEYAELIAMARKDGMTRLVLVGSGELAEIALLAAWAEDTRPIGILDPYINEPRRHGLAVLRSLEEANGYDAVVITNATEPQRAYEEMRAILSAERVLAPPLLKISSSGPAIAAQ